MSHIMSPASPAATTLDRLLGGRVVLNQRTQGYRAGLDAALLAAACDAAPGARVLEAGCGAGGALLCAAIRRPGAQFVGVERDGPDAELARANAATNQMTDRVTILLGDVTAPFAKLALPAFDAVMANPPFFDDPKALRAPGLAKRGAWMADGGLAAWTDFVSKAARGGGSITMIHRADRLGDLITLLSPKAGSFQILPIHPFADAPAKRVLVRAIKTGKAPLKILPPLVLHPREGAKYTVKAEAILRGEAALAWL